MEGPVFASDEGERIYYNQMARDSLPAVPNSGGHNPGFSPLFLRFCRFPYRPMLFCYIIADPLVFF